MKRVDLEQWRAREVARLLALVEAERRYYQEIVASMPVGLAILSEDLSFLSANRSFREVFDLTERALAKTRLDDLFPAGEVGERIQEVLESGNPQRNVVVQHIGDDGPRPLRVSIQSFRGWDEDANREVLLVVEDPEVRPPVEAAPGASQAGSLLDNLDAVIWERDPATLAFTFVSGRTEQILGYEAKEWTSVPDFHEARIHPGDRDWVLAFYRATASSSDSRSCEYRAIDKAGHTVWLRDVIRVVRDEEGAVEKLSGITVDVNAQKLRDEQFVQAEKMAALGRLAGKVTHDCNNLLMILSGYSEELLDTLPEGHAARGDVNEIIAATERLSTLTTELLNFTRRPSLSPKVFNLNALVENAEPGLRRELGSNIDLQLRLSRNLGQIKADWDQTTDAILTLCREARQAMPDGGALSIETEAVEIASGGPQAGDTLPPGDYVMLAITDSGPVPDEETRTRIFEPFFSSRRSGEDLPAVYSLVHNSGGDIQVASGPEGGTRFTIYLPVIEPATDDTIVTAPAEEVTESPKPVETILLAEDEDGIRALVRKILQKQGYHVLQAESGEEAITAAKEYPGQIHLLLTDVVMLGMTGGQLAEQLKADRPDVKVLFMSGYTGEDLASFEPLPADAEFLQKPFSLSALLDKVRGMLSA